MYDSYKDMAYDEALDNQDLRSQVKELTAERNELKRENCDLRMQIVFARQKLRHDHATTNPVQVDENKYECGQCCAELQDWWNCCRHVGNTSTGTRWKYQKMTAITGTKKRAIGFYKPPCTTRYAKGGVSSHDAFAHLQAVHSH